ncbi:hypothetical protein Tco_0861773 [Tanacetum coccineum]
MPKDPFPKSFKFNVEHYAILVAHLAPFHKYPEPFFCLVGISRYYTLDRDTYLEFLRNGDEEMDLLSFIRTADPMKVRVGERQRTDGEPRHLEITIGRVVSLLPVAPSRTSGELEVSVDKNFDEGGGGEQVEQGDSASGGQGVDIQPVIAAANTIVEDVAPLQPMRQKKRKIVVVDASEPSHPPKKLREDYGDPSGPSIAGKSRSAVQRLFAGAILNAEVRGEPIPTLPFVTSSMSATPKRNKNPTDSVTGPNLQTISAPSSTPIIATVVTATVDATATAKETPVKPSLFGAGSSSTSRTDPTPSGLSDVSSSDFLIGGIRTVVEPDFDLQKFFASIRGMEHDQLFTEFNVRVARQVSLSVEVRMHAEYNIKEKRKLRAVVEEKDILLKAKGEEVNSLKAQLLVKEAEAAEAIRLRIEASKFEVVKKSLHDEVESLKECNTTLEKEKSVLDVRVSDLAATLKVREQEAADSDAMVTAVKLQNDKLADQVHASEVTCFGLHDQILTYEHLKEQFEEFQDVQMRMVGDKLAKLEVDLSEMTLHFEEKFYHPLLMTITGWRWLLTHGLKLFLTKCLNSFEYLSALGAAISRAIEKGMQDGLAAGIKHGTHVDFALLAELKSHKDASVKTIKNLLRLESPLVDVPGMSDLQPDEDQLMVPIHRSEDQVVLGSTSLSFALSVSRDRVERTRKNIAEYRSALAGVYVPLVEPLSI